MMWPTEVSTGCCTERAIADALQSAARAGLAVVEPGTPPRHFDPLNDARLDDEVGVCLDTRLMLELHCPGVALSGHHQHAACRLRDLLTTYARSPL